MAFNSTIKPKIGVCPECDDGVDKPLISGKCQYHYWQGKKKPLPKPTKPIRPRSKKRAAQERVYAKQRAEIFSEEQICQFPGCGRLATEVHHPAGRIGELLTNRDLFVLLCHDCHVFVELNPAEAKKLGLSLNRIERNEK